MIIVLGVQHSHGHGLQRVGGSPFAAVLTRVQTVGGAGGEDDLAPPFPIRREGAALLAEAGYGPQNPLDVDILYNTNEGHKKIALAISSMWKHNLGVKAELNNMEWKTMVSALNEGDFGVSRYSWNGDYNDASTFLDIMTSSSSANSGKWFNKEYDALLAKAHDAKDPAERNRLYQQAEVLIDEEAPIAPVYFYVKSRLLKPNVKGYPYQNPQDLVYAKDLYLTAQ